MENNWFKNPGDLEEDKTDNIFLKPAGSLEDNETFLKPAGDLEEDKSKDDGMSYFQIAGDLDTTTQNNSFKFQEKEEIIQTPEEIREWLKTIVSGKKKSTYEFGRGHQAFSSGKILVGLDELKEMVENGDNIISAEYFEALNMVDIEFESFRLPSKSR